MIGEFFTPSGKLRLTFSWKQAFVVGRRACMFTSHQQWIQIVVVRVCVCLLFILYSILSIMICETLILLSILLMLQPSKFAFCVEQKQLAMRHSVFPVVNVVFAILKFNYHLWNILVVCLRWCHKMLALLVQSRSELCWYIFKFECTADPVYTSAHLWLNTHRIMSQN